MLLDDLGKKALDIAWEKIKEKRAPRRKLAQALLRIQESLIRCHEAYERCGKLPTSQDKYRETIRETSHDEYFEAIADLLRTLFVVKDILPVLDSKVASGLIDYVGDEVDTYYEPLSELFQKHGGFRDLYDEDKMRFRLLALSWGASGQAPDFTSLLADLRRFLKDNFTIDEMF